MKYVMKVLLVLVFFSWAAAQTLWGDTVYGMSPEEVVEAVPGTVPFSDDAKLASGAQALLQLEDIEILGMHFEARFYFLDNKLEQVNLDLKDPEDGASEKYHYEALTTALRARYGPEINSDIKDSSIGIIAETTWLSGDTNINLFLIGIGESPALLGITYQTRLSEGAGKL